MITLLEGANASKISDTLIANGRLYTLFAYGLFGGSDTVKLQVTPDLTVPWQDVADGSFSAAGHINVQFANGCRLRAVATVADTSSLNMVLV